MRGNRQAAQPRRRAPVFLAARIGGKDRAPAGKRRRQQFAPRSGAAEALALAPRKRPERDIHRPPGQRFRDPLEHQQIGRTGEHETARFARSPGIDRALDGGEQIAAALDFVEHQRGPWMGTTGVSASASTRPGAAKRGWRRSAGMPAICKLVFRLIARICAGQLKVGMPAACKFSVPHVTARRMANGVQRLPRGRVPCYL